MDPEQQKDLTERLVDLLNRMGPLRVWRPVVAPDGQVLAAGSGPSPQTLSGYLGGVDFSGKSVIDLGSNLGLYSFMAVRSCARHVLGLDIDEDAVQGARMLATLYGMDCVDFEVCDFLMDPPAREADMVLVVDFIGRAVVAKGRLDAVLAAAVRLSRREIVMTMHPVYRLEELPPLGPAQRERYAGNINGETLDVAGYVSDWLGPAWTGRTIHEGRVDGFALKAAMLYSRVAAH